MQSMRWKLICCLTVWMFGVAYHPAAGEEGTASTSTADDHYVGELLAILEKTRSPDTCLVALLQLKEADRRKPRSSQFRRPSDGPR